MNALSVLSSFFSSSTLPTTIAWFSLDAAVYTCRQTLFYLAMPCRVSNQQQLSNSAALDTGTFFHSFTRSFIPTLIDSRSFSFVSKKMPPHDVYKLFMCVRVLHLWHMLRSFCVSSNEQLAAGLP
ncbi:unnamed protein product [Ceratitis capitata]|uniref:(Mediterranean fruit fly) hypothetical protein n=1 Tax=Ceratitis capitata TaxID=7213 RepID=A0A811V341_CERCA|nr:unnamed protein product [Ceratitis capitata]